MNINQLRIDGFGAWTGLKLDGFEPGLNVIYGPNEAGKTTLLEFLRSMLYGYSSARRSRYLPPAHGGRPGGMLGLHSSHGAWQLSRHDDPLVEDRAHGRVQLCDDDGVELNADRLGELLAGVDERTFNHIFAIGLGEIQELGTLDDCAAGQLLYNLTTGLDRVMLGDVMRDLAHSRRRLLAAEGEDSQIPRLLSERNRLRQEIAGLADLTPRYARAVRQRDQLGEEIAGLERESADLSRQVRLLEAAVGLRDKWSRRALLDQQLANANGIPQIPAGAMDRLNSYATRLQQRKRLYFKLREERKALRDLGRTLPRQTALVRQSARIQALCDQQEWILGQERKADDLKHDIAKLEAQIAEQRRRLEIDPDASPEFLRGLSSRSLTPLRSLATAMEDAHMRLERARLDETQERALASEREARLEVALAAEPRANLVAAVQQAGERVSQLRRRAQLDQRLEQMLAHQQEIEDQAGDLLERQLLPLWVVVSLGGVFVLGVVLILAGWWLSFGWAVAVLGVAGIIASVVLKHHLENAAEQQLEGNEKQLALLKRQIQQAREERELLDEELPQGGGPILARLEKAEAELSRLENLLPVNSERPAVVRDTGEARRRLEDAESAWRLSQQRWQDALAAAGLPIDLTLQQVSQLSGRSRQLRELHRQLERVREEEGQTRQAVRGFAERVAQLLADVELMPASPKPSEQLRQLRKELASQGTTHEKRLELVRKDRRLRRRQTKLRSSYRRMLAMRRRLFEQVGALDEADFRRRVAEYAHLAELRTAREALQREIGLALGSHYSEDLLRGRLDGMPPDKLEAEWEELSSRLARCEAALKQRFERRGQLTHEIELLAADHRLPERQLELGVVQHRLKEATRQWQVRATTTALLESVRSHYERGRQPQTLLDASELLREMTAGRYTRVWTPMDEDRLFVEEATGQSLSVDVLSRGTREQLFLSLRLALVRHYARRGVRLPMVLDDVLVNFDVVRAKAAATLLSHFGEEGHQLLVFTCHEHIARLMRSLHAPVMELPNRYELRLDEPEPRPVKRPRSRRKVHVPEPVHAAIEMPAVEKTIEPPVVESVTEPVGYLTSPIEIVAVQPAPPPLPPVVEVLEAEPVVEPPILIAQPLPEPPRARPLVEEPPPLPSNSSEAYFVDYDLLLPVNHEPVGLQRIKVEQRPTPPIKVAPAPLVQPSRPRVHWGIFRGNGAEEFAGEFATRGDYLE